MYEDTYVLHTQLKPQLKQYPKNWNFSDTAFDEFVGTLIFSKWISKNAQNSDQWVGFISLNQVDQLHRKTYGAWNFNPHLPNFEKVYKSWNKPLNYEFGLQKMYLFFFDVFFGW